MSKILSRQIWLSDWMIIGYFAAVKLALHLAAISEFGYFRDELYYIACTQHLDFGFVDLPPLSILLLKAVRFFLGDSLFAIRILPALGGVLFIFLTGLITRELGGKKFALALASAAALATTGNFSIFHTYSMNFLDLIFWQICILLVIRIIKTENPKYWLAFGLTAGMGLQNKISVLFLCFGIAVGVILTKQRKHLKSPYLWIGLVLASLLFLPYIIWNLSHGWPSLEFMHNARAYKMADVSPLRFLIGQILFNNPITIFIWAAGLYYFFFHKNGKNYRLFGWMYLAIYILFTLQEAKEYYLAPAYPILFAGGAVLYEMMPKKKILTGIKVLSIAALIIFTFITAPLTLPLLSPENTAEYTSAFGLGEASSEKHEMGKLPQHFADMFGWEKMTAVFAQAYNSLTPEEQSLCTIYVNNYGEAGAIDFFGRKYDLPKALCTHNSYWFWGPGDKNFEVVLTIGESSSQDASREDLEQYFDQVEYAGTIICEYCMPYENNLPVFICKGFKGSVEDIWKAEKHFI